jgi:hypothetical protein
MERQQNFRISLGAESRMCCHRDKSVLTVVMVARNFYRDQAAAHHGTASNLDKKIPTRKASVAFQMTIKLAPQPHLALYASERVHSLQLRLV